MVWWGLLLVWISFAAWGVNVQEWQGQTNSPEETRELGERLGCEVQPGTVILLSGDLGAGKTCFAQGVARGLSVPGEIPVTSPSYTLLNVHYGRIPLYHFDLYRLSQVDDLTDLGYDDFAEGDGLTLVEWADRMTGALAASLSVYIERVGEEKRLVRVSASDERGKILLNCFGKV